MARIIVKITRGTNGKGLISYLAGPGREHENQRVITSSLGIEGRRFDADLTRELGADLMAPSKMYPEVRVWDGKGPVWHCSLSLPVGDGELPDTTWKDIAHEFMGGMGFQDDSRWIAVHHGKSAAGNDHIHVAANLVTESGTVVNPYRDYVRASKLASGVEQRYGLTVVHSRAAGVGEPGLSKGELARANGGIPERDQLRVLVRKAAALATDETTLMARLSRDGVDARVVRKGKGWAVSKTGSNVWYPGGALGTDLTWHKIRERFTADPPPSGRPTPGVYRAAETELKTLTRSLSTTPLTPGVVAGAAHDVAGALAAASTQPGAGKAVKEAAKQCGRFAGYKGQPVPRSHSWGAVVLALQQGNDPAAKVAQAVLVRQLLATFRAVSAAHRVVAETRGTGMAQAPALSAAHLAEQRAHQVAREGRAAEKHTWVNRVKNTLWNPEKQVELWTAHDIARSRIATELAERPEFLPPKVTPAVPSTVITEEQARHVALLSKELGVTANPAVVARMTTTEAAALVQQMEFGVGPVRAAQVRDHAAAMAAVVDPEPALLTHPEVGLTSPAPGTPILTADQADGFERQLVWKAGPERVADVETELAQPMVTSGVDNVVTIAKTAEARHTAKPVTEWKTALDPMTPKQEAALLKRGYSFEQLEGMPKGVASQHINGDLSIEQAEKAVGTYPPLREYTGSAKVLGLDGETPGVAEALKPTIEREVG